ncbi:MAG: Maf family protein [Candidatus Jettenia sp. CY-1]|nr:MAG: Maf family protein [Candidatus Jettenia sp. CY-1]
MQKKRFVLASNSPRRIVLLKLLGYKFDIIPHEIEEDVCCDILPSDLVQNLAFLKANDVAKRVDDAIIIAADTIISCKGAILGKPKDVYDAKRMLSMLNGTEHDVLSGICIINMPLKKKLLRIGRTSIKIRHITEEEIDAYIQTGEPLDKAGAYAIQGKGEKFIEKIDGSYTNVVGLPLEIVREMLNNILNDTNA